MNRHTSHIYIQTYLYIIFYKHNMTSRTTVAINKELRKKLKKLSAILDITQAEVIKRALSIYEKEIFKNKEGNDLEKSNVNDLINFKVQEVMKQATQTIWKQDPDRKIIQQKLSEGPETIDDFILNDWESGLE